MAYIGNSPGVASQRVVTTFTATAGQTTFTPSSGYTLGYCDVFYNGVKLVNGDDYTASNGTSVVLASAAAAGDSVEIVAHFPRGLSDGYLKAEADALLAQKLDKSGGTLTGDLTLSGGMLKRTMTGDGTAIQIKGSYSGNPNIFEVAQSGSDGVLYLRDAVGNTTKLATWSDDTSVLRGRVTTPNQPFFYGRLPGGTTKAAGWALPSNFYTDVVLNRGSRYDTSTGYFTCPVGGDYAVTTGGFIPTAGDGNRVAQAIQKNGSDYQVVGGQLSDGDSPFPVSTVIVPCSANDTLRVGPIYSPIGISFNGGFYGFICQIRLLG